MIEAIAAAEAYSREMDGLSFAVVRDGALIHESYAPGVTANTPTVSASMGKSVLGLVAGIALDDGLIASLDDEVRQYLPEWQDDPRGDIQLKHLLTMSSGLGSFDGERFLMARDSTSVVLETPRVEPPGVHFAYGNAVSQTLAIVIDRQARARGYEGYADYLQQKLWCPLGNADAQLWVDPVGMPRAYAGLHTGLHDWARLGELIRKGGRVGEQKIIPADWISAMTSPSHLNPQYGYQIWLGREWTPKRLYSRSSTVGVPHSEPFLAQDIVYFDGFGGQRVYVLPSQGLTIVRTGLTNIEYDDAVIPNLLTLSVSSE